MLRANAWNRGARYTSIAVLLISSSAWAGGQRPAMHRMLMQGSETTLNISTGGGVAQIGVPAAIYRSTECGFVSWIGGVPAWLDQAILANGGGAGAPLRTISTRACFDVCTLGGLCGLCQCMTAADLPFDLNVQMYDGDPCGSGLPVAGASGTQTFDQSILGTSFGGTFQCFRLNFAIDPKVHIPHEGWIEQINGVDDGWVFTGRPNSIESQGESNLSGLDDGVTCSTFCDIGGAECGNDPDRCDWMVFNLDSNAEVVFSLRPVPPPAESKWSELSTYTVVDNEAILPKGGEPVFLDVMVSDWDPNGSGRWIYVWRSQVDSSGYTSGLRGTLTPFVGPGVCRDDTDCADVGSPCTMPIECSTMFPAPSCDLCEAFSVPCQCRAAYIDSNREDYAFFGLSESTHCDVSELDYHCTSRATSRFEVPSPGRDSYLWTLVLRVPEDAKGTFKVDLMLPPGNALYYGNFVQLIGVDSAMITVSVGRCCLEHGADCVSDVTANECAALGGSFSINRDCDRDPCPISGACCPGSTCADEVPQSLCLEEAWFERRSCDDPEVAAVCATRNLVPTVSAWGGVIMTVLLLVGARIYGSRWRAT